YQAAYGNRGISRPAASSRTACAGPANSYERPYAQGTTARCDRSPEEGYGKNVTVAAGYDRHGGAHKAAIHEEKLNGPTQKEGCKKERKEDRAARRCAHPGKFQQHDCDYRRPRR